MQDSMFNDDNMIQPEFDADGNAIFSVEECHFIINEAVSKLGRIRVKGEINDAKRVRGSMAFFDMKDARGKDFVLKCSLFGSQFKQFSHLLADGMEVIITGRPKMYKTGSFSLVVENIEPAGEGAWKKALEQLKKKLEQMGYFDLARKRKIPAYVQRIGLITSAEGQAIFDFRRNLGEYGFQICFHAVWVEGEYAEKSIVNAIRWFNARRPDMDVLAVIRGGGGWENLKAYNSEKIAETIASSRIPVITGIGHEEDESIADLVADFRCSTPTAVADFLRTQRESLIRLVKERSEQVKRKMAEILSGKEEKIEFLRHNLYGGFQRSFDYSRHRITHKAEQLHRSLGSVFEQFANLERRFRNVLYVQQASLQSFSARMQASVLRVYALSETIWEEKRARVDKCEIALHSLNPENVLKRGYSVVYKTGGKVVKESRQLKRGDMVDVKMFRGKFSSQVEKIDEGF